MASPSILCGQCNGDGFLNCWDCTDGKVSWEQLAATWRAVHEAERGTETNLGRDELWSLYGRWELLDDLRSVKP